MSGVSYYQLLGLEPDASPTEIKAAWRDATDKFEPGRSTGQFRLFNEAADVLLDPQRRTAYDDEIAASSGGASTAPVPDAARAASGATVTLDKVAPAGTAPSQAAAPEQAPTSAALPIVHRLAQSGTAGRPGRPARPGRGVRRAGLAGGGRGVPWWVVAVLAVLSIAAVVVAGILTYQNHDATRVDNAGDEASASAERALPVILSYDYRHLSADRDQAVRFMSPRYQREYTATFNKLIRSSDSQPGPAAQTKAVVRASVESVGVVTAQPGRVQVIAFLNQTTTKGSGDPKLSLNRLTVSMVKSGNQWLVENITSY